MASPYDHQIAAMRAMLRAVHTPQFEAAIAAVTRQQEALAGKTLADLVSPHYERWVADVSRYAAPKLLLDYSNLFPDYSAIHKQALESLAPALRQIEELQRAQFAEVIATARRAYESALPPNWPSGAALPAGLEALLLDEGLALAWVPPADAVAQIFAAATPAERRAVIGRRWRGIGRACIAELDQVAHRSLTEHAGFGIEAAETLLAGSPAPSQALSSNLLDSILWAHFSSDDRRTITGQKVRLDISEYPLRVAIVLGGIWGAHSQFFPERNERIPRKYTRHGSVHGVSRRQYSRVNAVLALMHVTALLRVLEHDMLEP